MEKYSPALRVSRDKSGQPRRREHQYTGDLIFELLSPILGSVFEAFLEFVFDVLLESVAAVPARLLTRFIEFLSTPEITSPVSATVCYVLLGVLFGALSLLAFPHHLLHPAKVPGISLAASPTVAGLMTSRTGGLFDRKRMEATKRESFGYGFAFALGMVAVRFLFAK